MTKGVSDKGCRPRGEGAHPFIPWQVPPRRRCFSQRVRSLVRSQDDSKNLRMGNHRMDSSYGFFVWTHATFV